jgi:peroxiredoxin
MHTAWLFFLLSVCAGQTNLLTGPGRIGSRIHDFALDDHRDHKHRLSDWSDRKWVVVVFLNVDCPLARLYGDRLAEFARAYEHRGVAVLGIANHNESPADLGRYASEHNIAFPLLRDMGNNVADRFGAVRTPEAFVLDERRAIRYRGRIDDQYGIGLQRPAASRRDLTEALDELLAGKTVSRPETQAVGCLIGGPVVPGSGNITYAKDVAPILQQHCQHCHRPGQIAPFALTSYQDAVRWAATIREVVDQGRMPPWSANPKHGRFANDPSLSADQKQVLFQWIDAGCPQGAPAKPLLPPHCADSWNIQPDLVLSMARPFTVAAEGPIDYQFFEIDPGFTEDRWIQAAEIRPGNRAVVHHCNVYLQPPGASAPTEQGTLGSFALAAMAAGTPPFVLPAGMAKRIPAGWRLVFVMHYSAVGSEQTDRTSIALQFADPRTVRKEVATKVMLDADLHIPAHAKNHQVSQTWLINEDVLLLSMFPHMHLRGKSFRYEALFANGDTEVLLDVPCYDFNWQHSYVLAEPRRLPAGTRLRCTAIYDNSTGNPANPDPSAAVRTGPQVWDEMFNGYFDVVLAEQDLTLPVSRLDTLWACVRPFLGSAIAILVVFGGSLFLVRRWIAMPTARVEA